MIAIIVILGLLVVAESALIFFLWKVLKNTYEIVESSLDMVAGRTPRKYLEAYDGKYYPATVISKIQFNSDSEMIVTDFSLYDEKKIVGFTICTTESMKEYLGDMVEEDVSDEILEEAFGKPSIFKNVVVYAPMEGMWTWKSQE